MLRIGLLLWAAAAVVLGLTAEWVAFGWSDPRQWIPDLIVGWTFIACGLVASSQRPASRSGVLMAATGFTWFIGNFAAVDFGGLAWVAAHGVYFHRGPLVHLILAYPSGRPSTRLARTAVTAGYAAAVVTPVWGNETASIVLSVLLVAISAREYRRAVGRYRRERALSVWTAAPFAVVVAGGAAARLALPPGDVSVPSLLAYEVVLCSIAGVLLAGLLLAPWDRVAVTDLVVELGEARTGTLRGKLSLALGDPSLEVGYWLQTIGTFVDSTGRVLSLPNPGSERSVTIVERDGEPVAALVHDPAVLDDPGLVEAVTAAARLAASNARLQAEVQAQVVELAASRLRLLEAGDEERMRLERRLHDGAERRLVNLAQTLRLVRMDASIGRTREQVAQAEEQLEGTIEDLRRLADGLHPRILSEHGLEGALAWLADGFPVPIEIEITTGPMPSRVEAAAYFVCAEALANVAKYASASRVTVAVTSDEARVAVAVVDDGVGGADPIQGSGIRGLADRIETLGGALRVDSAPGYGTCLAAEIPLGDETN
jgi:signal transduction histidine kinase